MVSKQLDHENGLRVQAESAFKLLRKSLFCPSCSKKESISLTSAAGKRRFQCSCNKSWGVKEFMKNVLPPLEEASLPSLPAPSDAKRKRSVSPVFSIHSFSSDSGQASETALLKEQIHLLLQRIEQLEAQTKSSPPPPMAIIKRPEHALLPLADPLSSSPSTPLPSSSPSPSSSQRPTYASICKRMKLSDDQVPAALKSLAALQRRKPAGNASSSLEAQHNVRRFYIGNLPHLRLSELKTHLFNLHIQLSKILNMSYVGKSVVEFIILDSYESSFRSRINLLSLHLLEKYDPSVARDPNANDTTRDTVRQAFCLRLSRLTDHSTREPVRAFFKDWLESVHPSFSSSSPAPSVSPTSHASPHTSSPTSPSPSPSPCPSPHTDSSTTIVASDTPMSIHLSTDPPTDVSGHLDTLDMNADLLQPSVSSSSLLL
jgi:hypothetical protein